MKLIILRLDSVNKLHPFSRVSQKFESVYTLQGKNLTTWHTPARRAPRVATVHDVIKELGWVLTHPSVVFHTFASTDTSWVAWTLSYCTPMKQGKVLSNSATHEATQFVGPQEIPYAPVHNQSLFIRTQPTRVLIDTCRTTTLELRIYDPDHFQPFHPVLSTFP
jgi:hypothetical protein